MKGIFDETLEMIVFVIGAIFFIFILGVLGASFGGIGEEVASAGINAITLLIVLVLAIPSTALIIFLIKLFSDTQGSI